MLEINAFAKINLSLQVTAKRPDGYHDLVSVMQTVSLADTLRLRPSREIAFRCSDRDLDTRENLVVRAAELLKQRFRVDEGCDAHLIKRIPVAAGLAGGSSDAAATLRGLSRLWDLHADLRELCDVAQEVGSDVPFLLEGGTALVTGRGETVLPLQTPLRQWYVLTKPPFSVSTARVFGATTSSDWADGEESRALFASLRRGEPVHLGVNSLQPVLFRLHPAARRCYEDVCSVIARPAMVSGSGPTVIALCASRADGEVAADELRKKGYWTAVAHSQEQGESI